MGICLRQPQSVRAVGENVQLVGDPVLSEGRRVEIGVDVQNLALIAVFGLPYEKII